jgi:ubiquinone biosynthesis protein
MTSLARTIQIFWAFGRRNLFASLYLDLYRAKLSSRSCECEEDQRLSKRARRLREALEDLGPAYIKLGQILARRGDVFPPAYIKELEALQDHARPVPSVEIRRLLESICVCEHGSEKPVAMHEPTALCIHCNKVDTIFERFHDEPLAVASLAQVHRAKFHGEEVVVKVLKPGVLDILNRDLAILHRLRRSLIRWIGLSNSLNPDEFHAELQRSLRAEVDLQAEGLHMDAFRQSAEKGISAPGVHWGFLRDDILVMEFIQGDPLDKAVKQTPTVRAEQANRLAVSFLRQVFVHNLFHGDPHPGNLILRGDEIVFIDFGAVSRLDPDTQRHLARLLAEISNNDTSAATLAILELCGKSRDDLAKMPGLLVDVGLIVQGFRTGAGTRWSDRIVEIARRYDLKLPRSVITLAKALVLIEAMALKLDPEFRLQNAIDEFMRDVAPAEAKRTLKEIRETLLEYKELASEVPALIRRLADDVSVAVEARSIVP